MDRKEKKQLLFKDLSARLPYGVKCFVYGENKNPHILSGIKDEDTAYFQELALKECDGYVEIEFVMPLLRPMSSMTEEEWKEYDWFIKQERDELIQFRNKIKFYNKHHIDYNDLIPNGLAIEAPQKMYN